MKRIYLASLIAICGFALQSCSDAKSEENKIVSDEVIPVKVLPLQQSSTQQEIHASGQFTTEDETMLSFKTGGIINQIFVKEGDAVKRGQLLATLHLTEVNAQVQQARFAYEKALRDYNRMNNLYRDSVATLEQLQNTKTALDIAQQQLSTVHFNKNYSEIRATTSGYVLKKLANPGQLVNPGDAVLQTNGAFQSGWILKVGVSDKQWNAIKVGDRAIVQIDALPGQNIAAVVSKKGEGVDAATGTFTINVLVKSGSAKSIAAGLFGKAIIYTTQKVSSWSVPYDALLDGDAGEAFVFVTNDNKTAEKVKVTIGGVEKGSVTITSGLESSKALIVSGNAYLKERSAIKIIQ